MKRPFWNLAVDLTVAALLVGMVATGYILTWPLPPGTNKSHSLWGLGRHQWGQVHIGISFGLLLAVAVHSVLHWSWVVTMMRRQFGGSAAPPQRPMVSLMTTAGVLAACLVGFAWLTQSAVRIDANLDCATQDASTVDAGPNRRDLQTSPWDEANKLLHARCLSCHGPSQEMGQFRVDRGSDYSRKYHGQVLVRPGDSANSQLIVIVSGQRPEIAFPDRHRLSEADVSVIRRWIDSGARGESGAKE